METGYTRESTSSESIGAEKSCRDDSGGLAHSAIKVTYGKASCDGTDKADKTSNMEQIGSTTIRTIGSTPAKNLQEWGTGDLYGVPLRFSLDLLPNLFTKENLGRYGINDTAINYWFIERFIDICNVLNGQRPPSDQLDCTKTDGCGINDDCSLDEVCVTDPSNTKNYRCGER